MPKSILKLGTRKSLLAWAQSSWVAREVEKLNPGIQVELKGIETRGDRIQDVSLQSVEGKDFFVAEIDHALLAEEVDFTVHSMKDLSLDRPGDLACAAIPKRENPRDIVIFGPHVMSHLKDGRPLIIGTSSPRRLENIPIFLKSALPQVGPTASDPGLKFVEIRGNVNTRLSRVHESVDSPKYLDGVVLAFAGLIRLWADPTGKEELKKLLEEVRWMILPLKECPAAPAQGALAIECRSVDFEILRVLQKLHDPETGQHVSSERQLLAEWGGGCHQRFGATAIRIHAGSETLRSPAKGELEDLLFIRGVKMDGTFVEEVSWKQPPVLGEVRAWDGGNHRAEADEGVKPVDELAVSLTPELNSEAVFVAHWRAVDDRWPHLLDYLTSHFSKPQFKRTRVWVSGVASWFKLAALGIWVEGCAEGLGFDSLQATLSEPVLGLPELQQWEVLTHQDAQEEWKTLGVRAIPTYKINTHYGPEVKSSLRKATHIFWSSGSQLNELKEWVPTDAQHACGPGKTAARLRENGLTPQVFPSVKEWRKWLKISE